METIIDCFEFCVLTLSGKLNLDFSEFGAPQGECSHETSEHLIDLEDRYTRNAESH